MVINELVLTVLSYTFSTILDVMYGFHLFIDDLRMICF